MIVIPEVKITENDYEYYCGTPKVLFLSGKNECTNFDYVEYDIKDKGNIIIRFSEGKHSVIKYDNYWDVLTPLGINCISPSFKEDNFKCVSDDEKGETYFDGINLLTFLNIRKDKEWIKESKSKEEILELSKKIIPIVSEGKNKYSIIPQKDIFGTSYTWDKKLDRKVKSMATFAEMTTYHSYGYYGFFKPSIDEVLRQIPDDILSEVIGFEIINNPSTAADFYKDDLTRWAFDNGYHSARTVLYSEIKFD